MRNSEQTLLVYEDLAHWFDRQGQPKMRDWFLVLAADTALTAGQPDKAERLRGRLLHANPHHLLKPYDSFADALQATHVQDYVAELRRKYPPDAAQQLLKEQRRATTSAPRADPPPAA